ncbi:hypothetical protein [Fretibacterium sp. OH1220_COT-178]|uniref:hypothetical protein n=1 Tax=Fretibacterium sp. OH1220_COT-178 TaxID=2491047 RepID=UPI000F601DC8|nr:hypothetical protein [Fretibacterium sp. OH1220_COT-178]RRD66035.1 hypothetical protein EII26_01170 [Fretibacterium sp. OH1220_COT-178]
MSEKEVRQGAGSEEKGKNVVVVQGQSNTLGISSVICSIVSIFFLALLFAPLGLLLGGIAVAKKQTALGIVGILIAVVSLLMSPSFQLLLLGMGLR